MVKKRIRFYCRDSRWYADLPDYIEAGGTEEECEMVSGADEWLDYLSEGADSIVIKVSNDNGLAEKLHLYQSDEYGAIYVAHTFREEDINKTIWLCPVTLFVFGEYPAIIYYERVK